MSKPEILRAFTKGRKMTIGSPFFRSRSHIWNFFFNMGETILKAQFTPKLWLCDPTFAGNAQREQTESPFC
jgi:hypothetical protein